MGINCSRNSLRCVAVLLCSGASWAAAQAQEKLTPIKAEIRNENGRFQLYRGGRPYLVKGAVWVGDQDGKVSLKDLADRGANSIRAGANTRTLDEAHRLGLSVLVNLPMRMESVHKFDYSDEKAVRDQFEKMKERVLQVKDHPAVLMYAIGNELSVGYKNRQVWNAVNDVARMIHEVDPNHPALTVIGDGSINSGDIQEIMKRAPDLDLLGVNYYRGVEAVPEKIRQNKWDKPYVLTEWGPSGDGRSREPRGRHPSKRPARRRPSATWSATRARWSRTASAAWAPMLSSGLGGKSARTPGTECSSNRASERKR